MESRLLLDVVVRESATVFKLFSSEDKSLLIWWDSFLVLDLGFHVFNGVGGLNIESDRLAGEGLNEDLHATTEAEDQVKSGLLLDVVVRKGAAVFELFAGEDEALLIWRNAFLVLDLCLDVFNGVRGLDIECDCFSC